MLLREEILTPGQLEALQYCLKHQYLAEKTLTVKSQKDESGNVHAEIHWEHEATEEKIDKVQTRLSLYLRFAKQS